MTTPLLPAKTKSNRLAIMASPLWVPDSCARRCSECFDAFSLVKRRHHCRKCGKVFCAACCNHEALVEGYGDEEKQRVCSTCIASTSLPISKPKSAFEKTAEKGGALFRLFAFLDSSDVASLEQTCSFWRRFLGSGCADSDIWKPAALLRGASVPGFVLAAEAEGDCLSSKANSNAAYNSKSPRSSNVFTLALAAEIERSKPAKAIAKTTPSSWSSRRQFWRAAVLCADAAAKGVPASVALLQHPSAYVRSCAAKSITKASRLNADAQREIVATGALSAILACARESVVWLGVGAATNADPLELLAAAMLLEHASTAVLNVSSADLPDAACGEAMKLAADATAAVRPIIVTGPLVLGEAAARWRFRDRIIASSRRARRALCGVMWNLANRCPSVLVMLPAAKKSELIEGALEGIAAADVDAKLALYAAGFFSAIVKNAPDAVSPAQKVSGVERALLLLGGTPLPDGVPEQQVALVAASCLRNGAFRCRDALEALCAADGIQTLLQVAVRFAPSNTSDATFDRSWRGTAEAACGALANVLHGVRAAANELGTLGGIRILIRVALAGHAMAVSDDDDASLLHRSGAVAKSAMGCLLNSGEEVAESFAQDGAIAGEFVAVMSSIVDLVAVNPRPSVDGWMYALEYLLSTALGALEYAPAFRQLIEAGILDALETAMSHECLSPASPRSGIIVERRKAVNALIGEVLGSIERIIGCFAGKAEIDVETY